MHGAARRTYLTWLALGTAVMALLMAALMAMQLAQRSQIERDADTRKDALSALTFQFEREFLRFRAALDHAANGPAEVDVDALGLRYDIFISRLTLLRDNPSTAGLLTLPEYKATLPKVEALISQTDRTLARTPVMAQALRPLLPGYDTLGPDVQALSLAASSLVANTVERQKRRLLDQHNSILWLAGLQVGVLALAAWALFAWQRRQDSYLRQLTALAEDLRAAKLAADAANQAKSHFLANMSHEMRTPFNGIMGMIDVLGSTPLSAQQREFLAAARTSADRLLHLLGDVLDMASLDSGRLELAPVASKLPRLLQQVHDQIAPRAQHKHLALHWEVPADLPHDVFIDPRRFQQVLLKLLDNAVKFTDHGHIGLRVQAPSDARGLWRWVVHDSGEGMDSKTLKRLFTHFHQADTSATRRHQGAGLGLVLARTLAQAMGGDILVQSQRSEGSSFTWQLPLPPVPQGSAPTAQAPQADASPAPTPTPAIDSLVMASSSSPAPSADRPLHALIVEDNPINTRLMQVFLRRVNMSYDCVENGQAALEQVQVQPYDVILMDINMPVMDGITATRAIRALPGTPGQTPILVVSADAQPETTRDALAAGANAFLPKPVQIPQFTQALRQFVAHMPEAGTA